MPSYHLHKRRLQTIPEYNVRFPKCNRFRCIFSVFVTFVLVIFIFIDNQLIVLRASDKIPTSKINQHKICSQSLTELFHKPPKLHGRIVKQGVLPLHLWWNVTDQRFMHNLSKRVQEQNMSFLNGNVVQNGHLTTRFVHLPMAGPCAVYINHHYKFIFIKNPKIAGTSILEYFGWQCDQSTNKNGKRQKNKCFVRPDLRAIPTPNAASDMWKNYFVFAASRNPISRGASIYNYLLGRRVQEGTNNKDGCKQPSFKKFCFAPYIIGLQTRKNNCLKNHQHDFYHAANQVECLQTAEGLPAVDFILSMENLEQDFKELIKEIQSKSNEDEWEGDLKQLQKGPETGNYAAKMFHQCGNACIYGLTQSYKPDFEFLGYQNCTTQL